MTTTEQGPTLTTQARAAFLKALMDAVKEEYDRARGEADEQLRELYESAGVTAMEVRVPGIGAVAKLTVSRKEAAIAPDQAALLAWAKQRHPSEVESTTVETVRPAFMKALLARLVADEDGNVIDTDGGEVVAWARVVPAGKPTVSMTFADAGRQQLATAYVLGDVTVADMLGHSRELVASLREPQPLTGAAS